MANSPFDQRIINQLERPTSSDLNIAQSQLNANIRAFARSLFQATQTSWGTGIGRNGAMGNSFIVRAETVPSFTVTMTRGVGFAGYAAPVFDIDGITGLNAAFDYPVVYSQDRLLDLSSVAAPSAGTCRRDVIALRAIGQDVNGLADEGPTDIYEPTLEAFSAATRYKTLSADVTNANIEFLEAGISPVQGYGVVYRKGTEVPYTDQDSLLDAPISLLQSSEGPYINIAVVNRYDGQTAITTSDIADYRLMVAPGGHVTVTGSATVGSSGLSGPGTNLSDVIIKAPPGVKAAIYKLGADLPTKTNTYALFVAGPRAVNSASMVCTLGQPGGDYTSNTTLLPAQIYVGSKDLNFSPGTTTVGLLANSSKTSPVQTIAVGQPVHIFPFTVGITENVLESATVPVTVSGGSVTLPAPPGYPAMYPAGTYDVEGDTDTRTFFLNYGITATAPTTGITSPVFALQGLPAPTEQAINFSVNSTTMQRLVGFVADSNLGISEIPFGVWNLSIEALIDNTNDGYIQARVYLYNGTSNPEAGTLITESEERPLSTGFYSRISAYMRTVSTLVGSNSRLYVALYGRKLNATGLATITLRFNNNTPAVLATNIRTATPTVTIPDSTTNYPAGTYSMTGAAGTANIPGTTTQYPTFNPATVQFRSDPGSPDPIVTRTIPVNFTVTLNLQ